MALTDRLTLAVSRRGGQIIMDDLEKKRRRRRRYPRIWGWWKVKVAVVAIDLDFFKQVNDTFSHAAGDFVLKESTAILKGCLRSKDMFIRMGGEELLALLPGLSLDEAMAVAERMCAAIDTTLLFGEKQIPIPISASFGVAIFDENTPMEKILDKSDRALYRAKRKDASGQSPSQLADLRISINSRSQFLHRGGRPKKTTRPGTFLLLELRTLFVTNLELALIIYSCKAVI